MRVLFVCRANVIRSQMAAAFYNQLTGTHDADSAGTMVDEPDETLGQRSKVRPASKLVLAAMLAVGVDLSQSRRTQLTPDMPAKYDRVVNMAGRQYTPQWLSSANNYIFWDIEDPMAVGLERTVATRNAIEDKVKDFITLSAK